MFCVHLQYWKCWTLTWWNKCLSWATWCLQVKKKSQNTRILTEGQRIQYIDISTLLQFQRFSRRCYTAWTSMPQIHQCNYFSTPCEFTHSKATGIILIFQFFHSPFPLLFVWLFVNWNKFQNFPFHPGNSTVSDFLTHMVKACISHSEKTVANSWETDVFVKNESEKRSKAREKRK